MTTADHDLAELSTGDLRRAIIAASALRHFGRTRTEPDVERVAASLVASLDAERIARAAGRGRGTVRLSVDAFEDDNPDDSCRRRHKAIGYLQLVRDDRGEPDGVRSLFASVMSALADPSPVARQVELARLEALSGRAGR